MILRRYRYAVTSMHGLELNNIVKVSQISKRYFRFDLYGNNNVVVDKGDGYHLVSMNSESRHINGAVKNTTLRQTHFHYKD